MKISVIIPAYNEEQAIGRVIEDIKADLNNKAIEAFEILVVDDGSGDKTAQVARQAGAQIISNPVNMGYGFSLKRGIEHAQYEYLVTVDADGTYPADQIVGLAEKLDQGFDMVVGARRGRAYWSSFTKVFFRLIFKLMAEFVVGRRIPDVNSGFRAIRKSKILPVLPDLSKGFSFSTSVTLIFFLKGYFVRYLPVEYHKREGRTKVRHFHDGLRALQIMFQIIANYNPIKLFMLVAFLPFLLFIGSIIASFWIYPPLLLLPALISLLTALLILSLGFFADIFRKK